MTKEVEAGVMWTKGEAAKDSLQPPEAGRGQEDPSLEFSEGAWP